MQTRDMNLKRRNILRLYIAILIVLGGLLVVPVARAQDQKPVVRGYLFYLASAQDPAQIRVRTEIIPLLYREFAQQVQIMAIEASDEANYRWWLACKKAYGVSEPESALPALFIGDRVAIGQAAISQQARAFVQEALDQGGVDYPDVPRPGGPLEPTVRFMFFWSSTCGHCQYVKENVFPPIQDRYGGRVQWGSYNVGETENYLALLRLEELAGLPKEDRGGVPVVFIGDEYSLYALFFGSRDIPAYLPTVVDWFMGIGGVDLPGWTDELFAPLPEATATGVGEPTETPAPPATATLAPTPTHALPTSTTPLGQQGTPAPGLATPEVTPTLESPTATPKPTQGPPGDDPLIHMAYFAETGCSECDRVSIALKHVQAQFPNLVIHEMDVLEDLAVNLCLSERLNVPEKQRHDAPAVFVGTDYLVDADIDYDSLVEMVSRYAASGADPIWETCEEKSSLPPPPPWWAVIVPGLIDGINPCAFATIIFFVSYLSILRRKGKEVLMVGIAFTLAVFLAYLAFGMVLRELFAGLIDLVGPILRPILNLLTALLCLVLAILGFDDFRKARRGQIKDATLQLPHKLRMWINTRIRNSMRSETVVAASFASGVVVSFIELACTGQVYVPIIQGLSNPAYRAQSTIALLVYCLAFTVPLMVVFTLSYLGADAKHFTRFLTRYAAPIKLLMTLVFLCIGLWLVYDVLRIWGLDIVLSRI